MYLEYQTNYEYQLYIRKIFKYFKYVVISGWSLKRDFVAINQDLVSQIIAGTCTCNKPKFHKERFY